MKSKVCNKCGINKPYSEYYKCKAREDGLQYVCKVCSNKASKKFREKRPDYYWGKDGYLTKRKEEFSQYVLDRFRADKSCKVYKLTLKDGSIYIGETKAFLYRRMQTHKADYLKFRAGKSPNVPYVYVWMLGAGYSDEDIQNVWKSVEIIEEFEGTKADSKKREKYWIDEYIRMGYTLRNYVGVPKEHQWTNPKRVYTKRHQRWNKSK